MFTFHLIYLHGTFFVLNTATFTTATTAPDAATAATAAVAATRVSGKTFTNTINVL